MTKVEFWCDGSVLLGMVTAAPYNLAYSTTGMANGSHTFTCKSYDTAGHSTTSTAVAATVSNTTLAAGPWVRSMGGLGSDSGRVVAVDGSGNLVVAGYFQGTVDFGGGALVSAGGMDLFVAKFTAAGAHVWSKRFGGTGDEIVRSIGLDASGNIFVAGSFSGQTDLGGGALSSLGASDIFVAKYSSTGAYQWAKRAGGSSEDVANSLAVDASGNVIVTGFVRSSPISFGGSTYYNSRNAQDTFVVKFSGVDGSHVWSTVFWCDSDNEGTGVAVDASGNVLITGRFVASIDPSNGMWNNDATHKLSTQGSSDWYIAKFSPTGGYLWSRSYGGPANDKPIGIALDRSGNMFVLGFFTQTITLGGSTFTTLSTDDDVLLAKFSATDGSCSWAKAFRGGGFEQPTGLAIDGNGNVVITGYFQYDINLGGTVLNSASRGFDDVFVAKYSTSGSHLWSERFGGPSHDEGMGIAVDGSGHVMVTGSFMGTADFGGQSLISVGAYDVFLLRLDP